MALHREWHNTSGGRIRAAFAPRFAVSCSRELLEAVASLSRRDLTSPRLNAAHCVWVDAQEQEMLAASEVKVTHCPGSNVKLGSGIVPVPDMLDRGICVSLGSDGAACNNHLDMFGEMRLAALLQSVRLGPGALGVRQALTIVTRNGARALGLEADIGSIEAGKRADLILIDRDRPHFAPGVDPFSTIVYAARPDDVRMTMVDGEILVKEGMATRFDANEITRDAHREARALAARPGL